jgi:hypothetical protein
MPKEKQASVLPDVALYAALILVTYELATALISYIDIADKALHFPFPLTYAEGPLLDQVLRLARGANIYHANIQTPPYTLTATTPLFQLLQVPFIQTGTPTFWVGRVVSITSLILSALLIGGIVYVVAKDWIAAAMSAGLLFCFPHLVFGSVVNQPDTLALALSLGALLLLVRWPTRLPAVAFAAFLCATAIYTHPRYFIALPLGGLLWLWRSEARRQAVIWIALVSIFCGAGFVTFNTTTSGGFLLHAVVFNTLTFQPIHFVDTLLNIGIRTGYVLIGGALILIVERLEQPHAVWRLVSSYGFAAFISALTVMRASGNLNDWYEVVAAIALMAGAAITWLGLKSHWLKIAGILVIALQAGSLNAWTTEQYLPFFLNKANNVREIVQLAQIVKQANGAVLADEFMGLLPLNNQPILFQPFEFKQLEEAGLWDDAALIKQIERREFKAILLYETSAARTISVRWTPNLRKAIYAHYDKQQLLADTLVYVPKSTNARP